ncbi:GYD domain-containing protein [Azospirillum sp. A1-3]|uniref:GYD domain-containing protein n=1 Tax=Azospirillum sp. A1-3 TaxID=185874 RepID=UPI002077668B|nr:GYD domain-containing protein [Azospirillum sp. A1-3]MCM8736090.1 GYD domain-containing protein [Azospirillum sp. A1-3]
MATFIMLTRLIQGTKAPPKSTDKIRQHLAEQIGQNCPDVEWRSSFAVLGPYDFLDIFAAPGIDAAMRVATTVRASGYAHTEIWGASELHPIDAAVRTSDPLAE